MAIVVAPRRPDPFQSALPFVEMFLRNQQAQAQNQIAQQRVQILQQQFGLDQAESQILQTKGRIENNILREQFERGEEARTAEREARTKTAKVTGKRAENEGKILDEKAKMEDLEIAKIRSEFERDTAKNEAQTFEANKFRFNFDADRAFDQLIRLREAMNRRGLRGGAVAEATEAFIMTRPEGERQELRNTIFFSNQFGNRALMDPGGTVMRTTREGSEVEQREGGPGRALQNIGANLGVLKPQEQIGQASVGEEEAPPQQEIPEGPSPPSGFTPFVMEDDAFEKDHMTKGKVDPEKLEAGHVYRVQVLSNGRVFETWKDIDGKVHKRWIR